jgi:hypothetical protein
MLRSTASAESTDFVAAELGDFEWNEVPKDGEAGWFSNLFEPVRMVSQREEEGLEYQFSCRHIPDHEGEVFVAIAPELFPGKAILGRKWHGKFYFSQRVPVPAEEIINSPFGRNLITGPEAVHIFRWIEGHEDIVKRWELECSIHHTRYAEQNKEEVDAAKEWVDSLNKQRIHELQNWGPDEWTEQTMAEMGFAKAMNVHHLPSPDQLDGNVAGYRVRRAPNGLVLVNSDSPDDIFVAVKVVENDGSACGVVGWLRGSEGKLPQFYQKNCWVVPLEVLHDMEELPGKELLGAMPPYKEPP